jgi:hypothetical protein
MLGRPPLDEGSARRTDLYLTKHNIHKRQTFKTLARFEPAIPASERTNTYDLDGAANEIGLEEIFFSFFTTFELYDQLSACSLHYPLATTNSLTVAHHVTYFVSCTSHSSPQNKVHCKTTGRGDLS